MDRDEETLEYKLKQKLRTGEISRQEYDELFSKFEHLGLLDKRAHESTKSRYYPKKGSTVLEGGKINGPVSVTGRALVDGPLECQRLNVSGSTKIDGDLTVLGKSIISGTLEVGGQARFGNSMVSSGSVTIERDLYATNKCSISGRAAIEGKLVSDGPIIVTGQLSSQELKSTSSVKLDGKLIVDGDVVSKDFECLNGRGEIQGDIRAEMIRIFTNFRIIPTEQEVPEMDEVEPGNISQTISNVVNVFFPQLIKSFTSALQDPKPSYFDIGGNVEGKVVDISHTKVAGDITADRVSIGPNVQVGGIIQYREYIEVPEQENYRIEKIE